MLGFFARRNTLTGSKKNIAAHYDLANNFYQLWLDAEMQYTCAYFDRPTDTLEDAQRRKMDLVCRKLRLQPGELVVEAGCGWGGLALHMARNYGVRVKSFNISQEQIAFARERAAATGHRQRPYRVRARRLSQHPELRDVMRQVRVDLHARACRT